MALDSATRRASMMYRMLPFPTGTVDQDARQTFMFDIFATPLSVLWFVKPAAVTNWTDQPGDSTLWTKVN